MPDFSIGVDLGGTNLRIAAVSSEGQLLEKVTLGTKVALGRDHVINEMCDAIQHLSFKYKAEGKLLGAGIGIPGIIDMQTGMLRKSANLPGWSDYPVRAEIERRLGARVILENDANVAALGEQWLGAARGVPNMAVVTLGTGIGGGILLAGLINVFNLDMYVIGGGVSSAWDAYAPNMFEELRERSLVYAATAPADPLMHDLSGKDEGASAQTESLTERKTIITRALL